MKRGEDWRKALSNAMEDTIAAFQEHKNQWFGREHDIQSYLYHRVLLRAGFGRDEIQQKPADVPVRREHRLWKEPVGKQDGELKEVDLALVRPGTKKEDRLIWPVSDVVELKYPVEAKTGLTEHEDLTDSNEDVQSERYKRRSRSRFAKKFLYDYDRLKTRLPQAVNRAQDVKCHMIYFDLVRGMYFRSPGEIVEFLREEAGVDLSMIGGFPLDFTYICALKDTDASIVWRSHEFR